MEQKIRLPEEECLEMFVGKWQNSGRMMTGAFGPGGEICGHSSYEWGVGGKWLQYTSNLDLPGMGKYIVQGGVVFNNQSKKYDSYAVNSSGMLMAYEGDWVNGTRLEFLLTYPLLASRARIVYQKLPNGSIRMTSDSLRENGEFETYFETTLNRV